MRELSVKQRSQLIDLMEQVVERRPIGDSLLADIHVVYQFLYLAKDLPEMVMSFLRLIPISQWCQLTQVDVLSEEVMLELHRMVGFTPQDLTHWLRGLNYSSVQFFVHIAKEKDVFQLDDLVMKSRVGSSVIQGVYVDSLPHYFNSLSKLLEYALHERVSYKQYRDILAQLDLSQDEVKASVDHLIQSHHVLSKIQRSNQVLPFRIFCALFDVLTVKDPYLAGVNQVMDQLLSSSTVQKTMHLLNTMPTPVIHQLLERYIRMSNAVVLDHLNQELPNFTYGHIRKIVRRNQLGLNYKYE